MTTKMLGAGRSKGPARNASPEDRPTTRPLHLDAIGLGAGGLGAGGLSAGGLSAGGLAFLSPETIPTATPELIEGLKGLPFSIRAALRVILRLEWGTLIVTLPGGQALRFVGRKQPEIIGAIEVHDLSIGPRLMREGNVGIATAYIDGQWDSPDVTTLLEIASRNNEYLRAFFDAKPLMRLLQRLAHGLNRNTKSGSKRNIEAHYDLGNDFYATWLDAGMTYSSARFNHPSQDLGAAQDAKCAALVRLLGIEAHHHVLEIGCGWGHFAAHVARTTGARVTAITISPSQLEYTRARIAEAGLSDRVEVLYKDYRDLDGQFDRVASIEMFEAVGERYWPAFFSKLRSVLAPGGRAGLQIITIRDDLFADYRTSMDFIQKFVFPGGMLPSPAQLDTQFAKAGLACVAQELFGRDYARTLNIWRRRFQDHWSEIERLGYDERFKRIWHYYLCYCEAGFRAGATDVGQYILEAEKT